MSLRRHVCAPSRLLATDHKCERLCRLSVSRFMTLVTAFAKPLASCYALRKEIDMAATQQTLRIAKGDNNVALRLLSALVLGWERIPLATQGWLISDAALMRNGTANATRLPAAIVDFINLHKERPHA